MPSRCMGEGRERHPARQRDSETDSWSVLLHKIAPLGCKTSCTGHRLSWSYLKHSRGKVATMVRHGTSSHGQVPYQRTPVCRDDFAVSHRQPVDGNERHSSVLDDVGSSFDNNRGEDTGDWNEMSVCADEAFVDDTCNYHSEAPSPHLPPDQYAGVENNPMLGISINEYGSVDEDEDIGIGSQDVDVDIDQLCTYTVAYKSPQLSTGGSVGIPCFICTMRFSSRSNMIRHVKTKHVDKGSKCYNDWIASKKASQNKRRKERRTDQDDPFAATERSRSRNAWTKVQRQKTGL